MNVERFQRAEKLFHEALARPPHERKRFVFEQCADSWTLYRHVMDLVSRAQGRIDDSATLEPPPPGTDRTTSARELTTARERYEIVDVLGEGGMGIVYLANQTHPVRRRVALKVIKLGVESKRAAARFEAERQALALMSHPHIARFFEAGATDDGRMFFAMEYVPGLPITEYCDHERLTIDQRLRLFTRVCHAIHHAHQKGIIHRDVKPSNVLVAVEGDEAVPKVIDFGVARALNQPGTTGSVTEMGTVVGSLRYMSPEQADCRILDVDTRTDIYSLGAMLYELLTGTTPVDVDQIEESGYAAIQKHIQEGTVARPSDRVEGAADRDECARRRGRDGAGLRRKLKGELDWIVLKALERDRFRRYPSASEFAADIERYLVNEAVEAGPPGAAYRLRKFIERNRWPVLTTTAVAVSVLLGFGATLTLYMENRRAMRVAERQRDEILQLSDENRLASCIATAEQLYPPYPERIPDMRAWLQGPAADLARRLPTHRSTLEALIREARAGTSESRGDVESVQFADPRIQFHYDVLSRLVHDLERFVDPDPAVGQIASVRQRLRFAETVVDRSVTGYRDQWNEAIHSIADVSECPAYGGLVIAPQVGLVPLGRDPGSGLWEFAHIQSGAIPARNEDGNLRIQPESAIVLVLLPGGCVWMGSAKERGGYDAAAHTGDLHARPDEGPPHRVCLDPFFISKFEVTCGQWKRVGGPERGAVRSKAGLPSDPRSPVHPIEGINWNEASRVSRQMGLALPTEAQWEYAARAGTHAAWPCGGNWNCVQYIGNVVDQTALESGRPTEWGYAPWHDGFTESAPVGSFAPNAFGLHDVIGNVWEWCRDRYGRYDQPVAAGDGERLGTDSEERIIRGGGYNSSPMRARVSWRGDMPVHSSERIGVRPVRKVEVAGRL